MIRLLFAAVVAVAAGGAPAAQVATFSSRLEAVRVDVLVTDSGGIVHGLRPADFELLDNGVPQQIDLVSFEELPLSLVLALDMSESVKGERLDHLRVAGHALLDGLRGDDRAALMAFSHAVALPLGLTTDIGRLRLALEGVRPAGDTSLVDGVYAAMTLGGSGTHRELTVVFTDGSDTSSFLSPARVLESARHAEQTVYAVSVRGSGRSPFLRDLSRLTGGDLVEIESTTDLAKTFVAILDEFRQRYLLSYTPRGVAREGWHRLDVRIKGRRTVVRARAGYFAGS